MRAIVFSDSHGNYDVIEKIMERHKDNADIFIFLGDGERELELISYVYSDKKLYYVAGNCDWGTDKPDYDIIDFAGQKILFTHGHRFGVKSGLGALKVYARKIGANIALYGHTHIAYTEYDEGLYIMNPGSCGKPREGAASYGVVDITDAGVVTYTVEL